VDCTTKDRGIWFALHGDTLDHAKRWKVLFLRFHRMSWYNHKLLIVLILFYSSSGTPTVSTGHGATGNQGVRCSQPLKASGLPLNRSCRRASSPPRMKQVYLWPTSSRTPAAMTIAWGAQVRGHWGQPGSIFFQAAEGQGALLRPGR